MNKHFLKITSISPNKNKVVDLMRNRISSVTHSRKTDRKERIKDEVGKGQRLSGGVWGARGGGEQGK